MLRKEKNGVCWFEFALLQNFSEIEHRVFSRHGGVSEGSFAALNLGYGYGDSSEHVDVNRRKAQSTFSQEVLIVEAEQVHKNEIVSVIEEDRTMYENVDGLITDKIALALSIRHADCQAAIFYDPKRKVIGSVHAGWRGVLAGIYTKTIETFVKEYKSRREDILVCIGPSLGKQAAEFLQYREEFPKRFWHYADENSCIDLQKIAEDELQDNGIMPSHREITPICTFTEVQDFFSYRRNKNTGRNLTTVFLKEV